MERWTWMAATFSLVAVACSGRYRVGEVGSGLGPDGMNVGGMSLGAGDSSSGSSGGPSYAGGANAAGTSPFMNAGGAAPDNDACANVVPPTPLRGPFVEPNTLWTRVGRLIWGADIAPPSGLPVQTTYAAAATLVTDNVTLARSNTGSIPGVRRFVDEWLRLYGGGASFEAELVGNWEKYLGMAVPALPTLLLTDIGGGRLGAFAEPAFLSRHPTISRRGAAIVYSTLYVRVPPPPTGAITHVDENLPDRTALETAVADVVCFNCHAYIDPLGYPLGHFDAMGNYRERDHDKPIDVSGSYELDTGMPVNYENWAELGQKLTESCTANRAFARAFLEVALRIDEVPAEDRQSLIEQSSARMVQAFVTSSGSYEDLVVAFAQSPAALLP